eukprot:m.4444 g.4444  ORF g.4444 m.4444 type:complete len:314 (+) comp4491_c0_seq1:80-1021(+)
MSTRLRLGAAVLLCACVFLVLVHKRLNAHPTPIYNIQFDTPPSQLVKPGTIPKTIHQIWLGHEAPPCQWMASWMQEYTRHDPSWTYKLWRDKDIEKLHLVNADLYELEPHFANKADIARYEILYRFGGVFVDSDSLWLNNKSLDPLLSEAASTGLFVGEEKRVKFNKPPPYDPMYAVGVIGCRKDHPAMYHVIKNLGVSYRDLRFVQKVDRWEATGPDFFTAALQGVPLKVFSPDTFFPGGWWKTDVAQTRANAQIAYPASYMYQFGYSSQKHLAGEVTSLLRGSPQSLRDKLSSGTEEVALADINACISKTA